MCNGYLLDRFSFAAVLQPAVTIRGFGKFCPGRGLEVRWTDDGIQAPRGQSRKSIVAEQGGGRAQPRIPGVCWPVAQRAFGL